MGQPPLEDEIQAVLVVWETVFVGAVREPPVQVGRIVLLVVGANEDLLSALVSACRVCSRTRAPFPPPAPESSGEAVAQREARLG